MTTADRFLFGMLKGGVDKRSRDAIGTSIAATLKSSLKAPDVSLDAADAEIVQKLRQRGFAAIGPLFDAAGLAEVDAYFADKPINFSNADYGGEHVARGFLADRPDQVRFGHWDQDVVSGCPAFARAAHDQRLLSIAEKYLGAPPTISILTTWWSFPSTEASGGMQYFHHDRDDFRCLKLFVYLTDTPEDAGPHEFVDETHSFETMMGWMNRRKWADQAAMMQFLQWMEVHRKQDRDVHAYFSKENIRTITGQRGDTFLEDTRGLHRGVPPLNKPRWAFEICYSLMPKYNMDYKPVERPVPAETTSAISRYATRVVYR